MKKVPVTKDTVLCISIATHPGNFGATVLTAGFEKMGLDFVYKPLLVETKNLKDALCGIRALSIKGSGVSMPHKMAVLKYLDVVEKNAKQTGAVNTIVNTNGILCGYNTDVSGMERTLKKFFPPKGKSAHIIGSGGAARAAIVALQRLGCKKITLSNRTEQKAKNLSKEFGVIYIPKLSRSKVQADLLVNATPVGGVSMPNEMIVKKEEIGQYKAVMDVVVAPLHTKLVVSAQKLGCVTMPGYEMALAQAAAQFKLYTGKSAPEAHMMRCIKKLLGTKK